jgi:hypothetical protein
MKSRSVFAGYILILWIASGCDNRKYTLTILNTAPDGRIHYEVHKISASGDSMAYARGATLYLLSRHAYRKMSDNAKPFISKPTNFDLVDETGKNVDSLLGKETADAITEKLTTLIN